MVLFIVHACQTTNFLAECFNRIHIKNGIHILYDRCQTFQSHTCINIFTCQCFIMAFAVTLKLGKYIVPYFHIAVAVTANCTARFPAAVFFTAVIVNFRTWAARTCAVFPEIVLFTEFEYTISRNTDFFIPNIERLIVIHIHRRIKAVFFKADHFCQKLPAPCDRFMFKIITERKISEHFKKCAVTVCLSDILNIACTDTLLTCGHTISRRDLLFCKIRL